MINDSYETYFSTLSGNRRLEIIGYLLKRGPQSVTDISAGTEIEQSSVSHSLGKLLECQFVHVEVRGKLRYYSLNEETILPLFKLIDQHIAKFCKHNCTSCTATKSKTIPTGK